ncbi:MAG: hypothetical protein LBK25_00090 [Treponema sp.]|nr:hypothetical protein [Treponema sp.]
MSREQRKTGGQRAERGSEARVSCSWRLAAVSGITAGTAATCGGVRHGAGTAGAGGGVRHVAALRV